MKNSFNKNNVRVGMFGLLIGAIMAPLSASALSYSNPGSSVSSGDKPFSLSCDFTDYDAVGTYSIAEKMGALPAKQNFSFNGSDVKNADGSLGGYVFGNSETRRDWRMETGVPGSAIYRFTHFKQSDLIVANIDVVDGGGFVRATIDAKGPAATEAVTKAATAISTRAPVRTNASKTVKDAYAAQTVILATALKDAQAAEKEALAADDDARAEGRTLAPDMHSIKGTCRWKVAS